MRALSSSLITPLQGRVKGVLICSFTGTAAAFVSGYYGGPIMLYALLMGMSLNFLMEDQHCRQGIEYCTKVILRVGVALLGLRITFDQVVELGWLPLVIVSVAVASTIAWGWFWAKKLGLGKEFGLLSGGAVAICGASAAMAISAVLSKGKETEKLTLTTVVCVTALSTIAMVAYPLLVNWLDMSSYWAAVFLGASIHDVAQVVGAGYMISPEVGELSALVKLMRVATLVPVVLILILFVIPSGGATKERPKFPGFLIAFVLFVIANSLHWVPPQAGEFFTITSKCLLVVAVAALGMKTSFKQLAQIGWKPVFLIVSETLYLCGLVIVIWIFKTQSL